MSKAMSFPESDDIIKNALEELDEKEATLVIDYANSSKSDNK